MNLYIIKSFCNFSLVFGAYWADTREAAIDAAEADGCDLVDPYCCDASPYEVAAYHGPDFPGRQVGVFYYVKGPYAHDSGLFYVAADSLEDAWKFAESQAPEGYGTRYLEKLTRIEANALLEKGWNT